MNKERFIELITAYGSNPAHWHSTERAAMLRYRDENQDAQALIAQEAALDELLAARLPAPPPHLETLILTQMDRAFDNTHSASAPFSFWQKTFQPINIGMGFAFASACFAGILSAPMISDILNPPDMFAAIDVVTNNILLFN